MPSNNSLHKGESFATVNGPCGFIMGNHMACMQNVVSGTMCNRHNLIQPLFGTSLSNTLDKPNENVGTQG